MSDLFFYATSDKNDPPNRVTVEVFKTGVQEQQEAQCLIARLLEYFPDSVINFDLEDCDRILRIEGKSVHCEKVTGLLNTWGYACETLL